MPQKKQNQEAITMMISLEGMKFSDDNKSEIQILKKGEWNHPYYGQVKIDDQTIKEMMTNFKKDIRAHSKKAGLPVDEEHFSSKGAVGWMKKLINRGSEGLFAVVEWNSKGRQAIEDNIYKFFSPEFYFKFEDPETRRMHNNVLIGGALTNRPYFKGLNPVVLSEDIIIKEKNRMFKLSELVTKDIASLSDDEKKFITSKFSELSTGQKVIFDELKPEKTEEKKEEKTEEEIKKEADDKKTADDKLEADKKAKEKEEGVTANEGKISMSETEVKKLKEDAALGVKASEDLRKMSIEKEVGKLLFSDSNKEGKLPATANNDNKIVDFVMSLSEEMSVKFYEIVNSLPSAKIFGEIGEASYGENVSDVKKPKGASDESFELDVKAREIMKSNDKMTYEEALVQAEKDLK